MAEIRIVNPDALGKPLGQSYPPDTLLMIDRLLQEALLVEVPAVAAL